MRSTTRRSLSIAALLYSLLHFAITGVRQPLANFYGDFLASFPTWKMASLFHRMDLYECSLAEDWGWGPPPIWHYGPVLHLITIPLLAFPTLRSAYVAWLFVNYIFVVVAAIVAVRILGVDRTSVLVVTLVFCNFNPLYEALTQRTIEIFELMLLLVAWSFYRRGRDAGCGVAIGIAAMTKFLPLIFLPWFILRRRWRALAASIAVIVPLAIAAQLVFGWQHSGILIQLGGVTFLKSELDQSLSGMVARLIEWTHCPLPAPVAGLVVVLIALGVLMAFMLEARRREGSEDIEFGLLAAAMVLLAPHNEQYYFIFLLLPYLLLYRRYRERWSIRAALLALSFFLVAMPVPLSIVQRFASFDVFSLYLRAGIPFVGAALLVAVLVRETARPVQLDAP